MYLSARKYINKIDWNLLNVNSDLAIHEATIPQYDEIVKVAGLSHVENKQDVYGANVSVNADRKSTRLNSSHVKRSRMPSSA